VAAGDGESAEQGGAKSVRGPNAARSAATRKLILDAAVKCIGEVGYYGTTTLLVQRRAGVSRGSLLHQFPSKADLMLAVLDRITLARHNAHQAQMATARDDRHRFELLIDVLWTEISKPEGFVRLEVMVAAASDPELMKRIAPRNREVDAKYRNRIWALAQRLGVTDRDGLDDAVTAFAAAVRGLAIDVLYPRPGVDLEAGLALIRTNHMAALDRLVAAAAKAP